MKGYRDNKNGCGDDDNDARLLLFYGWRCGSGMAFLLPKRNSRDFYWQLGKRFSLVTGRSPSRSPFGMRILWHMNSGGRILVNGFWSQDKKYIGISNTIGANGYFNVTEQKKEADARRTPHNPHPRCHGTAIIIVSSSSSLQHGLYQTNCTSIDGGEAPRWQLVTKAAHGKGKALRAGGVKKPHRYRLVGGPAPKM